MPKSVWLLVAAALAVGGSAAGCRRPAEPSHPMRWARAWINALNSHHLEQVAPLLRPASTYEDPLTGGPRSGPSLAFYLVTVWTVYPAATYEVQHVSGEADVLAVEWTATGLGTATSETPLAGVFIIRLDGDALTSVRGYFDARPFGLFRGPKRKIPPNFPFAPPGP